MSVLKTTGECGSSQQNTYYFTQSKLVTQQQQIPLVLVLGWAGSLESHVKKFALIYQNFGYHTIHFAPTVALTLFQTYLHKKYALDLLDFLVDHKLAESPIMIHTFSNAGLFIYRHMSDISHVDDKYAFFKHNVKSLVSDSAPGFPRHFFKLVQSTADLAENQVSFKPLRDIMSRYHVPYIMATGGLIAFLVKNRIPFNEQNYFKQYLRALVEDKIRVPTLVFYSKADALVDWTYIMDYVEKRRESGIRIKAVEFENADHVMNYVKYPTVYLDHLSEHIRDLNLPPLVKSQL